MGMARLGMAAVVFAAAPAFAASLVSYQLQIKGDNNAAAVKGGTRVAYVNGVTNNEPNLVQGVTLAVSVAFVVINIIVDLLYVLINPRIRAV